MNFPSDKHLDIRVFGRIYDNTSATYKFYRGNRVIEKYSITPNAN